MMAGVKVAARLCRRAGMAYAGRRALDADPAARLAFNARLFGAVAHERCVVDLRQGTGDGTIGSLGDVLDH